jgi:hypothetical protein
MMKFSQKSDSPSPPCCGHRSEVKKSADRRRCVLRSLSVRDTLRIRWKSSFRATRATICAGSHQLGAPISENRKGGAENEIRARRCLNENFAAKALLLGRYALKYEAQIPTVDTRSARAVKKQQQKQEKSSNRNSR